MAVNKPRGIYIASAFSFLVGSLLLFQSFSEMTYGNFRLDLYPTLLFLASICFFISGIFIFQLKKWAPILFLLLLGINLVLSLKGVYWGAPLSIAPGLDKSHFKITSFLTLSLLPFVIAIIYFSNSKVKKYLS